MKYIILTIFLIVAYFGNCQTDTAIEFTVIPTSKLAQIGRDLYSCEVSKKFCLERELILIETSYNDSLIQNDYNAKLEVSTKDKNSLIISNKNLVKSNKLLKLVSSSTFLIIIIETLIIAL